MQKIIFLSVEQKNDYKMEEQSWFFTQIYNIWQMDQIWQNACVLWIRQLIWKQDFFRVNLESITFLKVRKIMYLDKAYIIVKRNV